MLYAPWVPTIALPGRAHRRAVVERRRPSRRWRRAPARLLGEVASGGAARRRRGRPGAPAPGGAPRAAVVALIPIWVPAIVLAWLGSQLSPAWAIRYLAARRPFLLAGRRGLRASRPARARRPRARGGPVGDRRAPEEKSNVRAAPSRSRPSLRPGDLVVATQPEKVPVLDALPARGPALRDAHGPVGLGVTDWRDGSSGCAATSGARPAAAAGRARAGRRLALVEPMIYTLGRWSAPWTELVRLRSEERLQSAPTRTALRAHGDRARPRSRRARTRCGPGSTEALTRSRSPRVAARAGGASVMAKRARAPARRRAAAHAPGEPAPDREAEAEAAARAGGAAAVEALEDALALLGRDPRARSATSITAPAPACASIRMGAPRGP